MTFAPASEPAFLLLAHEAVTARAAGAAIRHTLATRRALPPPSPGYPHAEQDERRQQDEDYE